MMERADYRAYCTSASHAAEAEPLYTATGWRVVGFDVEHHLGQPAARRWRRPARVSAVPRPRPGRRVDAEHVDLADRRRTGPGWTFVQWKPSRPPSSSRRGRSRPGRTSLLLGAAGPATVQRALLRVLRRRRGALTRDPWRPRPGPGTNVRNVTPVGSGSARQSSEAAVPHLLQRAHRVEAASGGEPAAAGLVAVRPDASRPGGSGSASQQRRADARRRGVRVRRPARRPCGLGVAGGVQMRVADQRRRPAVPCRGGARARAAAVRRHRGSTPSASSAASASVRDRRVVARSARLARRVARRRYGARDHAGSTTRAVMARSSAPAGPGRPDELVADVAHGADQLLVLGAELRAQPPHVHVDGAGAAEVVVAPDLLQQLGPGEDPARRAGRGT